VKSDEWTILGPVAGLIQDQLDTLGAVEDATHVTVQPESGRMRIVVATDLGILEYLYAPSAMEPDAPWYLRGSLVRWALVRGLRLQMDAQLSVDALSESRRADSPRVAAAREAWTFVLEEPKIEMRVDKSVDAEGTAAALALAAACFRRAR